MSTVKAIAIAVALIAGTAVITYTATTMFVIVEPIAAAPDDACQAVLAELEAAREEMKAQEEAFKKYASGKQFELGRGRGF